MWRKFVSLTLAVIAWWLLLSVVVLWIASSALLHPQRTTVASYLDDFLDDPEHHGILIAKQTCAAGKLPCLMVSADPQTRLGERSTLLRRQLRERGYQLDNVTSPRGIVVLLHGRHGRKENLLPIAERFAAIGFYCVIPDLPGHGDSAIPNVRFGAGHHEADWINQTLIDARAYFDTPSLPAGIWGISLGGAYANAAVASQPDNWQSMIIVSSFHDLSALFDQRLRWLPISARHGYRRAFAELLRWRGGFRIDAVNPGQWATAVPFPVLVVHGDTDRIIPINQGRALFAQYPATGKRWLPIPGAGHDNVLITDYPIYATMGAWWLDHLSL